MNATATTKEIPPPLQMLQLISGFWIARCVYVAAKLAIPDLLKDGAKLPMNSRPSRTRTGRRSFASCAHLPQSMS
jgi:hypothetical protein